MKKIVISIIVVCVVFIGILLGLAALNNTRQARIEKKSGGSASPQPGEPASPKSGGPVSPQSGGLVSPLSGGQSIDKFVLQNYDPKLEKEWTINAAQAVIEDDRIMLDDVQARGSSKRTNDASVLTAKKGTFDNKASTLTLQEDVAITTSSGLDVKTETLRWDTKRDVIATSDKVRVSRQSVEATGNGGEVILAHETAQLDKDVVVRINKDSLVTCKGPLKVYYKKNVAIFKDTVYMKGPDGELFADKMVIYFDHASNDIRRVVCTGKVKIIRENSIAYCDRAEYIKKLSKVLLRGNTKIEFVPR
jgi:hypothetical protein